ncbi:MAG: glycosyltransferase [Dehalococcoidia bacterium]
MGIDTYTGERTYMIVDIHRVLKLEQFRGVALDEQLDQVQQLAAGLKGLRVMHVNSTADGGGVAEILQSMVPLMRDIGLDTQWMVIPGNDEFFNITKKLHNLMQGAEGVLTAEEASFYVAHSHKVSKMIREQGIAADLWVMHDPQSLPLYSFLPEINAVMWVCHIDTTAPNQTAAGALFPWMQTYPLTVFSMPQYVLPNLDQSLTRIAPPAIDPLLVKNLRPDRDAARATMASLGLDMSRPVITQVARFDPWKDPWGVIDAYRIVKQQRPEVQLALLGVIAAADDPEAMPVFEQIKQYAGDDPDIHLFIDGHVIGPNEVAAVQTGADVVLQKSLREGFGLSVTEAMWKGTPTIGGNCGGIRLQIEDGDSGFLVDSPEQCAERIVSLLEDRPLAARIAVAGTERVRSNFLLPRLLADYLGFFHELGVSPSANGRKAASASLANM